MLSRLRRLSRRILGGAEAVFQLLCAGAISVSWLFPRERANWHRCKNSAGTGTTLLIYFFPGATHAFSYSCSCHHLFCQPVDRTDGRKLELLWQDRPAGLGQARPVV